MDNWASIESTFIADGRYLREHGPRPLWQPLWYCGTRFDYVYPPALRYGTAYLSRWFGVSTARSYHLYTAALYVLGIIGVYLFVAVGSQCRLAGWLAAASALLLSPSFLFLKEIRDDAAVAYWLPQRLNVLVRYGEGPHMSALALLPFALAAGWTALRANRSFAVALASLFAALVVSNNFYGATALAMAFPILVWAVWLTEQDAWVLLRACAIVALAYGLTAFWLTPSFLRITLRNMQFVSAPGNAWSAWLLAAVALGFGALSWRWGRGRRERAWWVFTCGLALFFFLNVIGHHAFGFRVIGEPLRLVPELDLALLVLLASLAGWLARKPDRRLRAAVGLAVLLAMLPARFYIRHAWEVIPADPNYRQRVEFQLADWMAKNLPGVRAVVSGSLRFWYNAWHDLPQVGGGSEQGLLNEKTVLGHTEIVAGQNAELAIAWMQALGAGAVVVHDARSAEIYHDYPFPEKFEGKLKKVFDNAAGDRIYEAPRRWPALARVVDLKQMHSLRSPQSPVDFENVRRYAEAVERGPDVEPHWSIESPQVRHLRVTVAPGQAVLVQESFDPYWRAYANGRRLHVEPDVLGFQLIHAPVGQQEILLRFETPLENRIGAVATAVSVLLLGYLAVFRRRRFFTPLFRADRSVRPPGTGE